MKKKIAKIERIRAKKIDEKRQLCTTRRGASIFRRMCI